MPVLHTYRSKEGHYILAGVNGRIVTYRLSSEGARRLQDNSVTDGEKFSWAMLLELIRQGDAYTSNSGTDDEDLSGWTQLGLLFNIQENEPSFSDLVPLCSCGSMGRVAHNLSFTIPGVESNALIHRLKNKLSFSAGSACSTIKVEPSHVLKAIGLSDDETFQTIRLGLGQSTQDAAGIANIMIDGIGQLKKLYLA